jgi:hypothetical protein
VRLTDRTVGDTHTGPAESRPERQIGTTASAQVGDAEDDRTHVE